MKRNLKRTFASLTALALFAIAGTFVSCADEEGDGDASGSKWERTFSADAREEGKDSANASKLYKRAFKQIGSKEKVQAFTTTVTVDTSAITSKVSGSTGNSDGNSNNTFYQDSTSTEKRYSNVGLMFDFHNKNDAYDFVLIGYRPYDKGFYVERYENIPENGLKDDDGGFLTNDSSIAGATASKYVTATSSTAYVQTFADQVTVNTTEKTHTFTVKVTQETKGTYTVYIGSKEVGTIEGKTKVSDSDSTACGGLATYANAAIGTLAKATFVTDKGTIEGSLFDEVIEE